MAERERTLSKKPGAAVLLVVGALLLVTRGARAQTDAGARTATTAPTSSTPADAGASSAERVWASCLEHIPAGAGRPVMREHFPARGTAGYAIPLTVTLEHGKGETVLPQGFHVQGGSDAARAITEAGFTIPDPDGGASPALSTTLADTKATTVLVIPFVALPKLPGRHSMTLPPVPIALARASGEVLTLCTLAHDVVIEDPTASIPDAKPKANPLPRTQREEWTLAKQFALGTAASAPIAALLTWLVLRQLRKPKPVPPPPPPRPPWEVALEELFAVRHAGLVTQGRFAEHFDRVSDAVRKYLGGRYGFDGLESTTDEMASTLRRMTPQVSELSAILQFLGECDLVKFARMTPTEADCQSALDQGERIVVLTRPLATAETPPPAARTEAG